MTVGSQLKQTLVSLKGAQATMRHYKEHSRHEQARAAFAAALETVSKIVPELENRIAAIEFQEPQYKGT